MFSRHRCARLICGSGEKCSLRRFHRNAAAAASPPELRQEAVSFSSINSVVVTPKREIKQHLLASARAQQAARTCGLCDKYAADISHPPPKTHRLAASVARCRVWLSVLSLCLTHTHETCSFCSCSCIKMFVLKVIHQRSPF